MEAIYTIGHSTHSVQRFIELLHQHSIGAVCDVRSRPYSRVNPQFNRETLKQSLAAASIKYVFLGRELGARSEDPTCYCNGKVQYELLAKTSLFKTGIDRVVKGAREYRIALMCAEKEPLDCHRTILVARALDRSGIRVRHILANGAIEEHSYTLKRLISRLKVAPPDMFRSDEVITEEAYALQGQQIAYQQDTTSDEVGREQLSLDQSGS